jgi:hypothetical protein
MRLVWKNTFEHPTEIILKVDLAGYPPLIGLSIDLLKSVLITRELLANKGGTAEYISRPYTDCIGTGFFIFPDGEFI